MNWKTTPRGNQVLDDGSGLIFISYRGNEDDNFAGTGFGQDKGAKGETALVIPGDNHKFRILNGDFRTQFEEVYPDKEKCIALFEANREHESSWSGK